MSGYPLPFILREALANALDANANAIEIVLSPASGTRLNRDGNRAFALMCKDNGSGCDDPEILRRVGSSTSDLHPEKRGRFGQGLIDVLAICDEAEILTNGNRIRFDRDGCQISKVRQETIGMILSAVIRHGGEGFDDLEHYFASMMLPQDVRVAFNGSIVAQRNPIRQILGIQLPTVVYDPTSQRTIKRTRETAVRIYEKHADQPMIHELGIPVDAAPWELPFDIDVAQKTPLDMERCMLPAAFKDRLISELVHSMSDLYEHFMRNEKRVPAEILNDRAKAKYLNDSAKEAAAETVFERPLSEIGRRNPFDPQDRGRSQELEASGVLPVNTAHVPEGMREILAACCTVEELHNERCKVHLVPGVIPELTKDQERCVSIYMEVASALLDRHVEFFHFEAPVHGDSCGVRAIHDADGSIGLNIQVRHLWQDPLGAESLGVIIHECAHDAVEGHAVDFQREIQRLAGKLAVWVGNNPSRWSYFQMQSTERG